MNLNKIEKVVKNTRNLIMSISFIFIVVTMVWSFTMPSVWIEKSYLIDGVTISSLLSVPLFIVIVLCIAMNKISEKIDVLVILAISYFSVNNVLYVFWLLKFNLSSYLVGWEEFLEIYFKFVNAYHYIFLILLISLIIEVVIKKKNKQQ